MIAKPPGMRRCAIDHDATMIAIKITLLVHATVQMAIIQIATIALLLTGSIAAHADFPSEIDAHDVDAVAERYNCEKVVIGSPTPGLLLVPRGDRNNVDGKYNQRYHTVCHVFVTNEQIQKGAPAGYTQRFLVYGATPETGSLMLRSSRLLLLLWGEVKRRLQRDHLPEEPAVQVWLSVQKGAGLSPDIAGEQFKSQIYLYDVLHDRAPIEWVRELAHEYGHYSLPGISGYTDPEEWANGILGEKLFIKWLDTSMAQHTVRIEDLPFVTPAELKEFDDHEITPLVEKVISRGPDRSGLAARDASGMTSYVSLALYADSLYGSNLLKAAINATEPSRQDRLAEAQDFYRGLTTAISEIDALKMQFAFVMGPAGQSVSLFLPPGQYHLDFSPTVQDWMLRPITSSAKKTGANSFIIARADWYQITSGNSLPKLSAEIYRITAVRKD